MLYQLELLVALYYETGQIHEEHKNYRKAQELYTGAMTGLEKLSCTTTSGAEVLQLVKQEFKYAFALAAETSTSLQIKINRDLVVHPIALLILNRLVETLFKQCKGQTLQLNQQHRLLHYSQHFVQLWELLPFHGSKRMRRQIFGRQIPLSFTLAAEARLIFYASFINYFKENPHVERSTQWTHPSAYALLNFCNEFLTISPVKDLIESSFYVATALAEPTPLPQQEVDFVANMNPFAETFLKKGDGM